MSLPITTEFRIIEETVISVNFDLNNFSKEKHQTINSKLQEIIFRLNKLHRENFDAEVDTLPGVTSETILPLFRKFNALSIQQGLAPFFYVPPFDKEMGSESFI